MQTNESHTPASLKKEKFRLIPQSRTFSKNSSNFIVDANFFSIIAKDEAILAMGHYKQYECI